MALRICRALLVVLLLGGCAKPASLPAPVVTSVEPESGRAGKPIPVLIHGDNFFVRAAHRIGEGAAVNDAFSAALGELPLEQVLRVDDHTLSAVIPAVEQPGSYPLTVVRDGARGTLDGAFAVTPAETNCRNGVDEDGDGRIDCADSDCVLDACDDGDPCTVDDVCSAAGTCAGSAMSCGGNGPCQAGVCDAGSCALLPVPDAVCDDGAACSFGDRCDSSGNCAGTGYACVAPSACLAGACEGDGGCAFTPTPGVSCGTSGTCLSDGGCVGNGPFPFVPSNFVADAFPTPTETVVVDNCVAALDTTTDSWVLPCSAVPVLPTPRRITLADGTEADLILLKSLTLTANSTLGFFGSRPMVIAVFGDATIDGMIFANSEVGSLARRGPGANPVVCGSSAGSSAFANADGAGGGGFLAPGGRGGGVTGGDGGVAVGALALEPLRGGCPGGDGNQGSASGGSGGGAFQLSVSGTLILNGHVSVSGAGGGGANASSAGGGGGGSGGMLLVEAKILTVGAAARLTANGGGGGGGAGSGTNRQGSDGTNGMSDAGVQALGGPGGGGSQPGGAGGVGGALAGSASNGVTSSLSGSGGGGGGVGAIFLRATPGNCSVAGGTSSPTATLLNCP